MFFILLSVMPFMVCLFWTIIYAVEYRSLTGAQRWLGIFLGVCAALYYCHAFYFLNDGVHNALADSVYAFCNLAVFPLFYLYILRLTTARALTAKDLWVLMPAIALCAWTAGIYVAGYDVDARQSLRMSVGKVVFVIEVLAVCFFGCQRLQRFDRKLEDYYSEVEHREVRQIGLLTIAMLACALFSAVVSIIGREYFTANKTLLAVPSLLFSAVLFVIAYEGRKQTFGADELDVELSRESEIEEAETGAVDDVEGVEAESGALLLVRLQKLIEDDKAYLECDLKLTDVAERLRVSRSTLSAYINQTLGVSFSDYVNSKRLAHAKSLMRTRPNLSLVEVSELSGFASASSFYRAFKKYEGATPKEWIDGSAEML